MSKNQTIQVLEVPCGRGKTTKFAVPTMKSSTTERFVYFAPTKAILAEVEKAFAPPPEKGSTKTKPQLLREFIRIDSDTVGEGNVKRKACEHLAEAEPHAELFKARCLGLTHDTLGNLTPALAKGRTLIIDEMPQWFEVISEHADSWEALLAAGLININIQQGEITLTSKGNTLVNAPAARGPLTAAFKAFLRGLKCPTRLATHEMKDDQPKSGQAVRQFDPEVLRAASKVVLLVAESRANFFREYVRLHKFETVNVDIAGLEIDPTPLKCVNATIFWMFPDPGLGSLVKIDRDWKAILASLRGITRPDRKGSLAGTSPYLVAANVKHQPKLAKLFDKSCIVSPTIRGENKYSTCDRMLWLAATRMSPTEFGPLGEFLGTTVSPESRNIRHIENMYQFVMRGVLRGDNNASARILVLTKGDAEALAKQLGVPNSNVNQCKPVLHIKKKPNRAGRPLTKKLPEAS